MAGDDSNDPLTILMQPPANECPSECAAREARETEAKLRSDAIDEELMKEKERLMRTKNAVKVMLLGNSESGKAAMVKNLRMQYGREEYDAELGKRKFVVQHKITKSVVTILDVVQAELNEGLFGIASDETQRFAAELADSKHRTSESINARKIARRQSLATTIPIQEDAGNLKKKLQLLLLRLTPLRLAEHKLRDILNNPHPEANEDVVGMAVIFQEDIKGLWADKSVQSVLKRRAIKLDNSAEYFLDDCSRILSRDYAPSDEDISLISSRAIVQEYQLTLPSSMNPNASRDVNRWTLYDIRRSFGMSSHAWIRYFEEIDVIMFFASLSSFDEYLLEDPRISQMEDSLLLWRTICGSRRLLPKAGLVLMMTHSDLLERKLERGVRVRDHLPSYGDRPNDLRTVVKFLKDVFSKKAKQHPADPQGSPELRIEVVGAVDMKATEVAFLTVEDSIYRQNLKNSNPM